MIHLHLGRGAAAAWFSPLLRRMRVLAAAEFPAADTVDLTISRMPHPAMPDAVLADVTALMPDGVHRVRGVGRTPQAAVDRVQVHLAARE
ncbi:hypothetical protein LX86_001065 [Lentzea aerocolonigenes]|nr:hypothetical protein [Lentzea aerocolonigenes]